MPGKPDPLSSPNLHSPPIDQTLLCIPVPIMSSDLQSSLEVIWLTDYGSRMVTVIHTFDQELIL